MSFGEGVERIFPLHSPTIDSLQVVSRGTVNRAKLFYLREKTGKSARIDSVLYHESSAVAVAVACSMIFLSWLIGIIATMPHT
jgi:hypothetical protein